LGVESCICSNGAEAVEEGEVEKELGIETG